MIDRVRGGAESNEARAAARRAVVTGDGRELVQGAAGINRQQRIEATAGSAPFKPPVARRGPAVPHRMRAIGRRVRRFAVLASRANVVPSHESALAGNRLARDEVIVRRRVHIQHNASRCPVVSIDYNAVVCASHCVETYLAVPDHGRDYVVVFRH